MKRPIHSARCCARATCLGAAVLVGIPVQVGAAPDLFAAGKPLFDKACGGCHEVGVGAVDGKGPMLNGIIGSPAGVVRGYPYSTADKHSAVIWTRQAFDAFIENPTADMPGTTMTVPGIASASERHAIFAYVSRFERDGALINGRLRTASPTP